MAKARFTFTFDSVTITKPVLYTAACTNRVVPNIMRASIDAQGGEIEVLLEGERADIDSCVRDVRGTGVRVVELKD